MKDQRAREEEKIKENVFVYSQTKQNVLFGKCAQLVAN